MTKPTETITAICTPLGDGGVAMIRLSGGRAFEIGQKMFSKDLENAPSHQMVYGYFLNAKKEKVDQGLIVKMKAPQSYTGEDVVEIFCHGGRLITQKILECALSFGATLAKPGEFTQRAYLNQKMDLAQAESVQSLICAQNEYALKIAKKQLSGMLSKQIKGMQQKLIDQAAILEAWVDFPEEGIEFCSMEELLKSLEASFSNLTALLNTYRDGQAIKNGFSLSLLGTPNVGKSSLMNLLLKKERAIVTSLEGTTRDIIEETLMIQGMPYQLMDTAGIRKAPNIIEEEGIKRALKSAKKADLILFVLDSSREINEEEKKLLEEIQDQKVLVIWNKSDLTKAKNSSFENEVIVSAMTGTGLDDLYQKIASLTFSSIQIDDQVYITEKRHEEALKEACTSLEKVIEGLKNNTSPEWLTFDLKNALKSLSKIMGYDITESILSSIFSRFCIGK